MAYFPAFIQLNDKKILIVGGGYIAFEKLEKLLDFTTNITLIAKEFSVDCMQLIEKFDLTYEKKSYEKSDVIGFEVVIAAVDDFELQEEIYFETRGRNCLCNCVDLQKYCDFIFPSYVKKGDLTIAVSTSGASPALAKQLRIYLSKLIPDSVVEFLLQMKEYRKSMPKGKERMQFLDKKAQEYVETFDNKKER